MTLDLLVQEASWAGPDKSDSNKFHSRESKCVVDKLHVWTVVISIATTSSNCQSCNWTVHKSSKYQFGSHGSTNMWITACATLHMSVFPGIHVPSGQVDETNQIPKKIHWHSRRYRCSSDKIHTWRVVLSIIQVFVKLQILHTFYDVQISKSDWNRNQYARQGSWMVGEFQIRWVDMSTYYLNQAKFRESSRVASNGFICANSPFRLDTTFNLQFDKIFTLQLQVTVKIEVSRFNSTLCFKHQVEPVGSSNWSSLSVSSRIVPSKNRVEPKPIEYVQNIRVEPINLKGFSSTSWAVPESRVEKVLLELLFLKTGLN